MACSAGASRRGFHGEAAVTLPPAARELVEIQIIPPSLYVRDPLKQAEVDRIAYTHGVLSRQTWSQHLGLDYDQEQKNLGMDATP